MQARPGLLHGALIFVLLASPAHADTIFTTLEGQCVAVMVLRQALDPEVCQATLVNSAYKNGRRAFVFTLERNPLEVSLVTFLGDGHDQLLDGQTTIQSIDSITFVERGRNLHLDAIGSCRITLQLEGLPSVVSCVADTERGRFAGDFVSANKATIKRVP